MERIIESALERRGAGGGEGEGGRSDTLPVLQSCIAQGVELTRSFFCFSLSCHLQPKCPGEYTYTELR